MEISLFVTFLVSECVSGASGVAIGASGVCEWSERIAIEASGVAIGASGVAIRKLSERSRD